MGRGYKIEMIYPSLCDNLQSTTRTKGKAKARLYSRQEDDTVAGTRYLKDTYRITTCVRVVTINAGHRANRGNHANGEAQANTARNGGR